MKSKLQKANEKLIEAELRNYKETKKELDQMREEILEGSQYSEVAVQTAPGDSTYSKVARLLTARAIIESSKRIDAIEHCLKVLTNYGDKQKLELIEMKYFQKELTDYGIMQRLNIEKTTFYRWKREVLQIIAERLGWVI